MMRPVFPFSHGCVQARTPLSSSARIVLLMREARSCLPTAAAKTFFMGYPFVAKTKRGPLPTLSMPEESYERINAGLLLRLCSVTRERDIRAYAALVRRDVVGVAALRRRRATFRPVFCVSLSP